MLKRLNMIPPSDYKGEDAHTEAKKHTTLIFTEVPSVIPSNLRLQLDKLDIHRKSNADLPASPNFTTTNTN